MQSISSREHLRHKGSINAQVDKQGFSSQSHVRTILVLVSSTKGTDNDRRAIIPACSHPIPKERSKNIYASPIVSNRFQSFLLLWRVYVISWSVLVSTKGTRDGLVGQRVRRYSRGQVSQQTVHGHTGMGTLSSRAASQASHIESPKVSRWTLWHLAQTK